MAGPPSPDTVWRMAMGESREADVTFRLALIAGLLGWELSYT